MARAIWSLDVRPIEWAVRAVDYAGLCGQIPRHALEVFVGVAGPPTRWTSR